MSRNWYFTLDELKNTTDIDWATANRYRRNTCDFLQKAGIKLRLPQVTIATGIVYFHRFYARKSFKEYDMFTTGVCCLFLSGKVEETPKKLRDVIKVTHMLRTKNKVDLQIDSKEYIEIRDDILMRERIVLQTIAFDLTVEHPYKFLLSNIKKLFAGDKELAQVAWNFVNDSLRTSLCLQYRPSVIASAAIYLASKFLKRSLTLQKKEDKTDESSKEDWWEVFDAKISDLENISNQILDLYQKPVSNNNKLNVKQRDTKEVKKDETEKISESPPHQNLTPKSESGDKQKSSISTGPDRRSRSPSRTNRRHYHPYRREATQQH